MVNCVKSGKKIIPHSILTLVILGCWTGSAVTGEKVELGGGGGVEVGAK